MQEQEPKRRGIPLKKLHEIGVMLIVHLSGIKKIILNGTLKARIEK